MPPLTQLRAPAHAIVAAATTPAAAGGPRGRFALGTPVRGGGVETRRTTRTLRSDRLQPNRARRPIVPRSGPSVPAALLTAAMRALQKTAPTVKP